ncbi:inner membrane protein translocase component YidC [Candidatus Magnetobacterium bavaricum]|uniref:Membrane protein insertase YidC n=1 Tax=Candidatus Magnetobacterium bavaricum TaxID=29290 RepID=A0A0F3GI29_9BACT|nr:inner membrane protein translocase component YidC [Candidatus Magnetobacterium bavaricum]
MERRALIAVALSVFVLIVFQFLYVKPHLKNMPPPRQTQAAKDNKPPPATSAPTPADTQGKTQSPPATSPATTVVSEEEKLITVQAPLYTAVLSSRGGAIKSFRLKNYKDGSNNEISLFKAEALVPAMTIGTREQGASTSAINPVTLLSLGFTTASEGGTINTTETKAVVFEFAKDNRHIKRTYTFYGNSYKIDLKDEVSGLDPYYITLGSDFYDDSAVSYGAHLGPVILQDMDRIEIATDKKLDAALAHTGNIKWIASENKYFVGAIVPLTRPVESLVWKRDEKMLVGIKGAQAVNEYLLYAGPKKFDILKTLNVSLEHVVDFGFFSFIARPLFWTLLYIDGFVGNYGWSIILLTLLIRIPFIPLISKGQRSMKKLQKVQPLMNDIRERNKKDPQKMQREIMELYKKHKVNPMGGCLPILIQIPVFFALYKVLLVAIELRAAPFMFWLKDLSVKDPYYILPIIMGITMLIQQKMTPTTMDPMQNKIMMFMPIVFTFMFLNFPSGLVLYWLVSNVLSIVQQFYINKMPDQTALLSPS